MIDRQMTLFDALIENHNIPKTYTGIYSMHKYWSKKPYNIIRNYILQYTNENDIVLDPFSGSGIAIIESIITGRRAFGIDINPSATFITRQTLTKFPVKELKDQFRYLEKKCKDKINSLYLIHRDGKAYIGTHFLWNNKDLVEVWYCNGNSKGKKFVDMATINDSNMAKSFTYEDIQHYYPKSHFFHNPRINAYRERKIYELFTPRNLMALSFLLDEINKIENQSIRNLFKFCFTASLGQASKMVFAVKRRGKTKGMENKANRVEVGSWVIGYWIPKENFEINVWNCFENRWKRIIKAKTDQLQIDYVINEARNFNELFAKNANLLLVNDSAINTLKAIPSDSIDYIITDPPHGDRIPYLELSMMWNEWMEFDVNYKDEIIISDSKDRDKNKDSYYISLYNVLIEIERVLKPNHYFSLIFNSLDDDTWINLFQYLDKLKFELCNIDNISYSANSVVQDNREFGLKTDFVLTFKKNIEKTIKSFSIYSCMDNEEYLTKIINGYISSCNNIIDTYNILNYIIKKFICNGIVFRLSEILDLIRRNYTR